MRDALKTTMVEDLCTFSASYGNAMSTKDVRWLCPYVHMLLALTHSIRFSNDTIHNYHD